MDNIGAQTETEEQNWQFREKVFKKFKAELGCKIKMLMLNIS